MIERGLITAAIVVVIIGAMGALGEQVSLMSDDLACRMQAHATCTDISAETQNGSDTQSRPNTEKRK